MAVALSAKDLQKSYKHLTVLAGVELTLHDGEVCALLGRNGAGKSTFIRILLGLAFADSGRAEILGSRPGTQHSRVAFLSENLAIYPYLTAIDNLRVAALSAGRPAPTRTQAAEMLDRVALVDVRRKRAGTFSLGMKRRLQLAMATLSRRADFLILDEPTNGLDVHGLHAFKEFLTEERARGTTVLMASHALLELQEVITSYAVLEQGVIQRRGEWDSHAPTITSQRIQVAAIDLGAATSAVSALGEVRVVSPTVFTIGGPVPARALYAALHHANVIPEGVEREELSLEDIFQQVVDGAAP
ncbi:MAG: ABC transporter ATP-binding protein [Propioniciclava sp.]